MSAIKDSLRCGVVRKCSFTISFRSDVYNFLFSGKGSTVSGRRCLSYSENDFNPDLFPSDWFVSYDRLGDGAK